MLGLDRTRLGRYARVPEAIGLSEFAEHLKLRLPTGLPLTWSHFERLATVRDPMLRRKCAEFVANEGLSVSDLGTRMRHCKIRDHKEFLAKPGRANKLGSES